MSYNSSTENLGLPQWILSDPPQMSDFNSAFSAIDAAFDKTLAYKQDLTTEDLDDIQITGIYVQNYTSNATTDRHYPVKASGCLMCVSNQGKAYQYYICQNEGCIWMRRYNSKSWSDWDQIYPGVISVSDDNGTAIKFPDGTMIATQKYDIDMAATTYAYLGDYITEHYLSSNPPDFPVAFIAPPSCTYSLEGSYTFWIGNNTRAGGSPTTTTHSARLSLLRPKDTTLVNNTITTITVTAVGRWK